MSKKNMQQQAEGVSPRVLTVAIVVAFLFGVYIGGVGFSLYQEQGEESSQPQMRPSMPPPPQAQNADHEHDQDDGTIRKLEARTLKNPKDLEAWIQLGNHNFDTNRQKEAIRAYTRALELDPGNANVWTDLGVMFRRDNNPAKAIECFDKAIAVDPAHRTARFNKGIVYLHDLNNMEDALKTWEAILANDPEATTPDGRSLKTLIDQLRNSSSKSTMP